MEKQYMTQLPPILSVRDLMAYLLLAPSSFSTLDKDPSFPEVKDIDPGLASLQHEVEGWIEATYPFEDPVAIICNV